MDTEVLEARRFANGRFLTGQSWPVSAQPALANKAHTWTCTEVRNTNNWRFCCLKTRTWSLLNRPDNPVGQGNEPNWNKLRHWWYWVRLFSLLLPNTKLFHVDKFIFILLPRSPNTCPAKYSRVGQTWMTPSVQTEGSVSREMNTVCHDTRKASCDRVAPPRLINSYSKQNTHKMLKRTCFLFLNLAI